MNKIQLFFTIYDNRNETNFIKKCDDRALMMMEGNLKIYLNYQKFFDVDYINIFEFAYYVYQWLLKVKYYHLIEDFIYESMDHEEPILVIKNELDDDWVIHSIWELFASSYKYSLNQLINTFDEFISRFNLKLRELYDIDLQQYFNKKREVNRVANFDCTQFITFDGPEQLYEQIAQCLTKQGLAIIRRLNIDQDKLTYYSSYWMTHILEIKDERISHFLFEWNQSRTLPNELGLFFNSIKECFKAKKGQKIRLIFTNFVELNNYDHIIENSIYSMKQLEETLIELGSVSNPYTSAIINIIL